MRVDALDQPALPNALSIDVEDWYHAELVRRLPSRGPAAARVAGATAPVLELLERYAVRATFFVVGEVVRDEPDLVRRIHDRGHEIACHGMTHRPLWELTPAEFDRELADFKRVTHDVLGPATEICGFRAPIFSLNAATSWALPILVRHGYAYDASVFPLRGPLYGVPGAPLDIYPLDTNDPARAAPGSPLYEVPVAVYQAAGVRLPVGGGIYLRLLPRWLLIGLLRRIRRSRPVVLYVHPWETDRGTPATGLPLAPRLAMSAGVGSALAKVEALLQAFDFATVGELVTAARRRQALAPERRPAPANLVG
jgi:polysaccharide deacetylase family protein (PEP-CTERM system associated)